MKTTGTRMLALLAATTLLSGAACGGGSAKPTAAKDKATAERIVLTSADLPDFTPEPDDNSDSSDNSDDGPIDKCVNNNPLLTSEDKPRSVDGHDFTKDDGNLRVQSGATVAETTAQARQAFSDLKGALSSQCAKDGLKAVLEDSVGSTPGLKVGEITASPLSAPKVVDDVAGTRLKLLLQAGGEELPVFVDLTVLRQDRTFAGLFLFGSGTPFPDADRTRLTNLLGERMSGKAQNIPDTGPPPTTANSKGRSSASGATTAGFSEFRDPSGVILEHPDDWTVEPSSAGSALILFMDPPGQGPRSNVNILRQSSPETATLDGYTDLSMKQIAALPGATVGESKPTTLSGSPAYRVAYRGDLGSGDLQFLAVWTIRSGKAWLVTYTADPARFDEGLPEFERLLPTIQLPD